MAVPATDAFMRRAVQLSRRGFPMPNPHVGCVIVQGGVIVGEGYHQAAGGPHAEVVALAQARDLARGSDVFVTLEPCNHHGRTGPCSLALIGAGVRRVYVAMRDPNPKAAGGVEALTRAGVEVEVGLMAGKARVANEVWLIAMERRRPFVTLKAAITLDGKIARSDGSSKWITGEASRLAGHKLRAEMGAVLVGRRTIESDDPLLTARVRGVVNQPVRVVLDPSGRLLGRERVFGREAETLWLVDEHRATGSQVGVALQQGRFEVSDILEALWQRGIRGLLVEGGGQTLGTFLASGLVDRLCLFVAPKVFGRGICWAGSALDLPDDLNLELTTLRRVGVDFEANYLIRAKSTGTKCDPPSS